MTIKFCMTGEFQKRANHFFVQPIQNPQNLASSPKRVKIFALLTGKLLRGNQNTLHWLFSVRGGHRGTVISVGLRVPFGVGRVWEVKGRMAVLPLSTLQLTRSQEPAPGSPSQQRGYFYPRCSCWLGESDGESMSQRVIVFQRLSSESSHYFWANYLRPHVNKQPASVKTTLYLQPWALVLSLTLV